MGRGAIAVHVECGTGVGFWIGLVLGGSVESFAFACSWLDLSVREMDVEKRGKTAHLYTHDQYRYHVRTCLLCDCDNGILDQIFPLSLIDNCRNKALYPLSFQTKPAQDSPVCLLIILAQEPLPLIYYFYIRYHHQCKSEQAKQAFTHQWLKTPNSSKTKT